MTDHDALLRAIVENPAEDTPRLVFADWLDEHADAFPAPDSVCRRAAFIRDDIAMAQRDEYDPARLRWELIEKPQREVEGWVKGVVPRTPHGCEFFRFPLFRRGFLWAMNVEYSRRAFNQHLLAGAPVGDLPLERLRFISGAYHGVEELLRAAWKNRVSEIEFEDRGYVLFAYHQLGALERVTRLAFLKNAICAAEFRQLVSVPLFARLAELTITGTTSGPEVILEVARAGADSALRKLILMGCHVTSGAVAALFDSPAADRLESLALGGDRINAPGKFRAFGRVARPMALRSLEMGSEVPNESGLEAFLSSALVPGLRCLCLHDCSLNRDRTRLLATGRFENLRALYLPSNPVGNDGAAAIARSPHLAGLLVLDLSYSQVGDEGIEAILESPLADGLALLDLSGSPASAEMKEVLKARMGDRVRI
jgi:uncharacterized protein (TIGR02996 family)